MYASWGKHYHKLVVEWHASIKHSDDTFLKKPHFVYTFLHSPPDFLTGQWAEELQFSAFWITDDDDVHILIIKVQ
jgi:hypothetical protein